jgi:phosphoglycerol transferase
MADCWQREMISLPTEALVRQLSRASFDGIYVDRFGYTDDARDVVARLEKILETKPLESADKRMVFFNMAEFNRRLRQQWAGEGLQAESEAVVRPVRNSWGKGFHGLGVYPPEVDRCHTERWCASEGELLLENPHSTPIRVKLEMVCRTGHPETSHLSITGCAVSQEITVSCVPSTVCLTFVLPPGRHAVKFSSDAKPLSAPGDPRLLVFRVVDCSCREVN